MFGWGNLHALNSVRTSIEKVAEFLSFKSRSAALHFENRGCVLARVLRRQRFSSLD